MTGTAACCIAAVTPALERSHLVRSATHCDRRMPQDMTLPHDGKDKVNRNDWGYSIGGPIIKNKLFFFWSQEWNHEIRWYHQAGLRSDGCGSSW